MYRHPLADPTARRSVLRSIRLQPTARLAVLALGCHLAIAASLAASPRAEDPLGVDQLASRGAASTTITLVPSKDNTLFESETGNLSNGAGLFFFAGRTNQGLLRRGLLAFDIAASVPAGAVIESVELRMEMNRTVAGNIEIGLHRVLADWGEGTSDAEGQEGPGGTSTAGDATWLHTFYDTATWSTPGGDFAANASASQVVGSFEFYTWGSNTALVADVQSWLDDPSGNFGWAVLGDESANRTVKRFASRENTAPTTRPMLTVTYFGLDVVFRDGFESGDTDRWSSQVP